MKTRKKRNKYRISNYQELLAIKKELKKSIGKQEKTLRDDTLNVFNVFNVYKTIFPGKNKNLGRVLNNSAMFTINSFLVQFLGSLSKNKRSEKIIVPVISLGVSYLIVNSLNKLLINVKRKN